MEIFLIFLFFVVFAALGLVGVYFKEKKRTENIEAVAQEIHFDFSYDGSHLFPSVQGFQLFSRGRSQKIYNVLHRPKSVWRRMR